MQSHDSNLKDEELILMDKQRKWFEDAMEILR